MKVAEATFKVGDIVCPSRAFLRSTSWYTNVPINGKVTAVEPPRKGEPAVLTVEWCDGHTNRILACNVRLYVKRHLEAD